MAHDRRLVLGAVALNKVRIRNTLPAADMAREAVEPLLLKSDWFPAAPFRWVGIIFRYGGTTDQEPEFDPINCESGDLPIARELDAEELLSVHRNVDALARYFQLRTLESLLAVAERYDLPAQLLKSSLAETHAAQQAVEPDVE